MIIYNFKHFCNAFISPHNLRSRPLICTLENQPIRLIQIASPLPRAIANQIVIMSRQPPQGFKIGSFTNLSQAVNITLCTTLSKPFECIRPISSAFQQVLIFKKNIHLYLKILIHLKYKSKL